MSLILSATSGNTRNPAPQGQHNAVCVDAHDLGMCETKYGPKHKYELTWELEAIDPATGTPFLVWDRYTASLDEKSNLRKTLEMWRGRAFQPAELVRFDVEKLIGANCQMLITHAIKGAVTYANIQAVLPPSPHAKKLVPSANYVRRKNRPQQPPTVTASAPQPTQYPVAMPQPDPWAQAQTHAVVGVVANDDVPF